MAEAREHPRTIGWLGTSALALGGANQSLFVIGAILLAQGTAAVPLLAVGLVLSWMAAPGWLELVMMWPNRVGGIAASCAEAFRPYSPVLANLTGVCYWWGWVPTCGLTALFSATAIHEWYLPGLGIKWLAAAIVVVFTIINLLGIRWVTRLSIVIGAASTSLALLSGVVPVLTGRVDWHRATTFHLTLPFHGAFAAVTSAMAGLYLVGFAAPAFEAVTCHVGETVRFERNLPRAMLVSAAAASLYFVVLPVVWLGVLGPGPLSGDLAGALGTTFTPLLVGAAKAAAVWLMVSNMFHGTLQPLAGASRTLAQLAEDGLLPEGLARRNRFDTPWVVTVLTAVGAIAFLLSGEPPGLIAAANFTYLISIALPSVAVWLLRRHAPDQARPWRAPRGTVGLGLVAAAGWGLSTVLGFGQFGLGYVSLGLLLAYSGSAAYLWRVWRDRRAAGTSRMVRRSLHLKLTGAMLVVIVLDGAGYLTAINAVDRQSVALATFLQDIFVVVAVIAVGVGLILPGVIAHATVQVTRAAGELAEGTLAELTRAVQALGAGDLDGARAAPVLHRVQVRTTDELAVMAARFNDMQEQIAAAARALDAARDRVHADRAELEHLADHDTLTELYNRRRFDVELSGLCRPEQTASGGAVILIDLDNFKLINDSRGHDTGDEVLRSVASVLRARLRDGDVVARLGGDEFAVLLPGASPEQARRVAGDLVHLISGCTTVSDRGKAISVTASAGVVTLEESGLDAGQLMTAADIALYEAKARGRNQAIMADHLDGAGPAVPRQSWLATLRDALEANRFDLYAQPIVALATGRRSGYELLLRYRSTDGTVWPPGPFLQLAERYRMVTEIDKWVIARAFEILRCHPEAGETTFEINLSGPSLTDASVLDLIEFQLLTSGVPATSVIFEVTETAAIANMDQARAFAERLKATGCRFALDDFGAGFGSFHYLRHLPFDFLKIDGEFIREITSNARDLQVVKAVIDVAQCFGLETIAEFVEDEETFEALLALGVDHAQGHYVGRPEPVLQAAARRGPADRPRSAARARAV